MKINWQLFAELFLMKHLFYSGVLAHLHPLVQKEAMLWLLFDIMAMIRNWKLFIEVFLMKHLFYSGPTGGSAGSPCNGRVCIKFGWKSLFWRVCGSVYHGLLG